MSEFLKLVGNRVRYIRKERKLTQEELAELTGLQFSYIGGIERGERNISLLTLEKIAEGLQSPLEEFFSFEKVKLSEISLDKKQSINAFMRVLEKRSIEEIKLIQTIYLNIIEHLENPKK